MAAAVVRRKVRRCGEVGEGGASLGLRERESKEVCPPGEIRGRANAFTLVCFIIYFPSLLEETVLGMACAGDVSRRLNDPRHVNSY